MTATVANLSHPARKLRIWLQLLKPRSNSVFSVDEKLVIQLKSCQGTSEISQIHGFMVKTGLDHVPFTLSKLLAASVTDMTYAASIFRNVQNPNLFMFNTMLRGYSISEDPKQAFVIFKYLRTQQKEIDEFSFIGTLKACARVVEIGTGQAIHSIVLKSGHWLIVNLYNTLLHLYCACGRIGDARKLFDEFPHQKDLVSWNVMMDGLLHVSQPAAVLDIFRQMCMNGLRASVSTTLSILSAAGDTENFLGGKSLHGHCIKMGFRSHVNVITSLIEMYAKCGHIELGRDIFNEVSVKDVVLWNCMIDRYAKNGLVEEAVALLQHMKFDRVKPNSSTLAGLLTACAISKTVNMGQRINDYLEVEELELDVVLGTALINMYAKCGLLDKAVSIFDRMECKDVKTWTAMISGYGLHGEAKNAIELLHRMEEENGVEPNEVTFLAALISCSHGGQVTEGIRCFERMVDKYRLQPKVEHYGCIVDLLGRAGLLEEAHKLIKNLPVKDDATAWRTLLAACRVYGEVSLGESVKRVLIELNSEHPSDSMLLSSAYAIAGRLSDHTRTSEAKVVKLTKRDILGSAAKEVKTIKEAGCSIIEMAV